MKKVENTEVCLKNLITSLLLKNPIYTQIINLMKVVHDEEIKTIDHNICLIKKDNDNWDSLISTKLGISEIDIGRKIMQSTYYSGSGTMINYDHRLIIE
jgi:hypothetical protein